MSNAVFVFLCSSPTISIPHYQVMENILADLHFVFYQHIAIQLHTVIGHSIFPAASHKLLDRVFLRRVGVFIVQCVEVFRLAITTGSVLLWDSSVLFCLSICPSKYDPPDGYDVKDSSIINSQPVILNSDDTKEDVLIWSQCS